GIPHGRRVFPARHPVPPHPAALRLRHQGRVLELVAPETPGRGGAHAAPAGARRDRLRTRAGDSAMEPAAPRDDLPQARAASDGEELPARPLHARRRALRVLRRRHQHGLGPPGPLRLRVWPGRPREDPGRTQRRVRPRCRSDKPLRRQQRLAAIERPRLQPRPKLPARHARRAQAPLAQTHLRLSAPQHAHAALLADRAGRSPRPDRRPQRSPAFREPGDPTALHGNRTSPYRLSYFQIRASPSPPWPTPRRRPARTPHANAHSTRTPDPRVKNLYAIAASDWVSRC